MSPSRNAKTVDLSASPNDGVPDYVRQLERAASYLPAEQLPLLRRAWQAGAAAHEGQTRKSGEPYITHPVAVAQVLAELGLDVEALIAAILHDTIEDTPLTRAEPPQEAINLIAVVSHWARELMTEGAPLVHRLPGRMGWELRFVVQGGLRILDKIEDLGFDTFSQRPTIGKLDAPVLLWNALRMRRQWRPMKAAPPR
jgi:alkylation response protein AidB-like acyl-CoA dehydrogenase